MKLVNNCLSQTQQEMGLGSSKNNQLLNLQLNMLSNPNKSKLLQKAHAHQQEHLHPGQSYGSKSSARAGKKQTNHSSSPEGH